jgi:hypothetical protein
MRSRLGTLLLPGSLPVGYEVNYELFYDGFDSVGRYFLLS